jgi:DNA repair protein RadC
MPSPPAQAIIRTAQDAAAWCAPHLTGCTCEKLVVLHVDSERRLLWVAVEEGGRAADIDIPVRALVADAIRHCSAGLILAHCHPSGDPTPSQPDIVATLRLAELAAGLGIAVHDHLVFAGGACRSFRALGLL